MKKNNYKILFLLIFAFTYSFCGGATAQTSTIAIDIQKCNPNDIVFLNNYIEKNTEIILEKNQITLLFGFPTSGFIILNGKIYSINNTEKYIIKNLNISNLNNISLNIIPTNIDCDKAKQLILLTKETCDINFKKYDVELLKIKFEIEQINKEIKNKYKNIIFKKYIAEKIIPYYNQILKDYYDTEKILKNKLCNEVKIKNRINKLKKDINYLKNEMNDYISAIINILI